VEAVGADDSLAAALPGLGQLVPGAPLTLERVQVCKRDGVVLAPPPAVSGTDARGRALWQRLTVHTGDGHGPSIHGDVVRALRAAGHAGATTLRGVWGFQGDRAPHGDRLLQLRRHAPVMTVLVDVPDRIAAAFAIVDALTPGRGLVTSEVVPALVASGGDGAGGRGGLGLADPWT
ncbi:MAG: hypothetical protein JWP18_370, partial [Solirubrobacterales bacterium]|nr:hypothetical protein [Solirubrobacterales bacterium]